MKPWYDIIPDFKAHLHRQFHVTKPRKDDESDSWAVSLKEVRQELFHPKDQDNKENLGLLEDLVKVACQMLWSDELVGRTKATFQISALVFV